MIERYIFDLDLPAGERWLKILEDFEDEIPELKLEIDNIFMKLNIGHYYQKLLYYLIKIFSMGNMIMHMDEIQSISNFSGIPVEKIVIMQLYYEMTSACTSVVTKINDRSAFFRTMDWDFKLLKKLTIELDVRKNGRTLYYATTWVGCVGLYTLSIPNKYSLAINYRRTTDINIKTIIQNAFRVATMYWPASYLLRHIAENDISIEELNKLLCSTQLVSPTYITVCYHGSKYKRPEIYTRNSNDLALYYSNDFVVQTNCDSNKFKPNILYSIERRNLAEEIIESNNNKFDSIGHLFNSFAKYPIINHDTIYVTLVTYNENNLIYSSIVDLDQD